MKLIDILRAESKWTKKQHRKKKKAQNIKQNKWNKKLYRQYQSETGKNNLFKLIPKDTPYCYTSLRLDKTKEPPVYNIKPCPFWYAIEIPEAELDDHIGVVAMGQNHIGGCKLLKQTDDDMEGWGLLWDNCKECGLNYGFGDFK
jgi:hypothetical protein